MSKYAMVLLERVIDIVLSKTEPYYPPDINGNPVMAVECAETVLLGMSYNDGTFAEYVSEPEPQEPPLSEAEQTQLELALNVEYLTCLMELND